MGDHKAHHPSDTLSTTGPLLLIMPLSVGQAFKPMNMWRPLLFKPPQSPYATSSRECQWSLCPTRIQNTLPVMSLTELTRVYSTSMLVELTTMHYITVLTRHSAASVLDICLFSRLRIAYKLGSTLRALYTLAIFLVLSLTSSSSLLPLLLPEYCSVAF